MFLATYFGKTKKVGDGWEVDSTKSGIFVHME
jgi:hypothetical protein